MYDLKVNRGNLTSVWLLQCYMFFVIRNTSITISRYHPTLLLFFVLDIIKTTLSDSVTLHLVIVMYDASRDDKLYVPL